MRASRLVCDLQIPFPTKTNQDSLEKWLHRMIQEHHVIPNSKDAAKTAKTAPTGLRSQLREALTGAKNYNIANVFRSMNSQ